jgi:hypothetical protein
MSSQREEPEHSPESPSSEPAQASNAEGASSSGQNAAAQGDTGVSASAAAKASRKRTKTGCLSEKALCSELSKKKRKEAIRRRVYGGPKTDMSM